MTNRQVNTFTAGLMVIALLSLIVLTLCSGCADKLPTVNEHTIHHDIAKHISVIEYSGNEYLIVSSCQGIGICPVMPSQAQQAFMDQHVRDLHQHADATP